MPIFTPKDTSGYVIPSSGLVLYVSPTGSTTNAGASPTTPTNFTKAMSLANTTGTTIVFLDGVYLEEILVSKPNVTLMAYPGSAPVIDGRQVVSGWTQTGSFYSAPFPITFQPQSNSTNDATADFQAALNMQQLWLDDKYLHQVQALSQLTAGKFYYEEGTSSTPPKFYLAESPVAKTVRAVSKEIGISASGSKANGTKIRGLNVIGFAYSGIRSEGSTSTVIEGCIASYNSYEGISIASASSRVSNCVCIGNGKVNLGNSSYKDDFILEDCVLKEGNKRRFNPGWGAASVKLTTTFRAIIRRNVIGSGMGCAGLWLDIDTKDCEVYENVFTEANIGIFVEISFKSYIVNNLFLSNNVAYQNACSEGVELVGNNFIDNNIDVILKDDARTASKTNRISTPGYAWTTRQNIILNNYHKGAKRKVLDASQIASTLASTSYLATLANNQYVGIASHSVFSGTTRGKTYSTVQAFRVDYPTLEAASIQSDSEPQTKLKAAAVSGVVLRLLRGVQPDAVGSTVSTPAPVPAVTYVPPTEAEYAALRSTLDENENRIADLENDKYIDGLELARLAGIVDELRGRLEQIRQIATP